MIVIQRISLNFFSLTSGEAGFPNGFLQLAGGASCVISDEFILVLEDCQGYGQNSFKSKT